MLRRRKPKIKTLSNGSARAAFVRPAADIGRAAATMDDIERRFADTPWWQFRRLDREHLSPTLSMPSWFPDWHRVEPQDVAQIAGQSGNPIAAGGLLSMHPNGYVREAAVYVLARSGQVSALPFLIVRAADWVEQVRGPAQEAVEELLGAATGEELL